MATEGPVPAEWVSTTEAALRIDDGGLTEIIRQLHVTARDARD